MSTRIPLTRRWRSKTFDEIIGQDIAVRLIKNSLYRGFFFPVYLFAGQRGCGKTTMGRVFAAAINCAELQAFQADPVAKKLPCGSCNSCSAMARGEHPDFLEIDAASHTGVDNVRQIIESASFLPIMGRKKIYLVDEAHMLSRAAFNACLKMLEEPPAQALFILATTEPEKIPETVRSRCMQLFFGPVAPETIVAHLTRICDAEHIAYDSEALKAIALSTEGSVRDAVNCLEQTAVAFGSVTLEGVQTFVGRFVHSAAEALFTAVCTHNVQEMRTLVQTIISTPDLIRMGDAVACLVRDALWKALGVPIVAPATNASPQFLQSFAEALAQAEISRIAGRSYRDALECALIGLFVPRDLPVRVAEPATIPLREPTLRRVVPEMRAPVPPPILKVPTPNTERPGDASEWQQFIARIEQAQEPLVTSIFKQAHNPRREGTILMVSFPSTLSFFADVLASTKTIWSPLLEQAYGGTIELKPLFDSAAAAVPPTVVQPVVNKQPVVTPPAAPVRRVAVEGAPRETAVADPSAWPTAANLLEAFPGTLTKIS